MHFPGQGPGGKETTDNVLRSFGSGARLGLRGDSYAVFRAAVDALPWNHRAFFHEGHAMGIAARSAMRLQRGNPEEFFPNEDYVVMRYVGYGFWNGACTRYPAPRLKDTAAYWASSGNYEKYRLLQYNGYGFAAVMFNGAFSGAVKQRILSLESAEERDAALHGVGRVLWFLYMHNFDSLTKILEENRENLEALGIGLGLAIGFTQAATPEKILKALNRFPEWQRRVIVRGTGIALEVHTSNETEGKRQIDRLIDGDLRTWRDIAVSASAEAGNGSAWYRGYHEGTAPIGAEFYSARAETQA